MKKALKIATALIGLALLNLKTEAQTIKNKKNEEQGVVYSVGIYGGPATGSFNDTHKWGLGGTVQADIPVMHSLYLVANAGFLNFFGKEINSNSSHFSVSDARFLPVKTGVKYFPFGIFYVQADAGVSFALNKNDLNYNRSVAFIYSPQVGARLPLGDKNNLDLGVLYERSSKFKVESKDSKVHYYGLKIVYPFSLGK